MPDLNDSDTIYSSSGSSDVEAVVVHSDTSPKAQAEVIPRKVIAHPEGQTKTKERTKKKEKNKRRRQTQTIVIVIP